MPDTLEAQVRRLVMAGEREFSSRGRRAEQKAVLVPQYQLLLKALGRGTRPLLARADDFLRIVRALRDHEAIAHLAPDVADDPADAQLRAAGPLGVLSAYLTRLPGTALLFAESGAGESLALCALRGGAEPLDQRVALAAAGRELRALLARLAAQHGDMIEALTRGEFQDTRSAFFARTSREAWQHLPEEIARTLAGARTILFLPGAAGQRADFPLELLLCDDGWLGSTRAVARISSYRTLLEVLSPNRMPALLSPAAHIVRAQDADDLQSADEEIHAARGALTALGLDVAEELQPRVATVRALLDSGARVLHYIGHGYAGHTGEALPLARGELLGPHDFSQLSGAHTPFVYLSTCAAGRMRPVRTGGSAGVAVRLLEKGAPAVLACLHEVPDLVARDMASAFYAAAASQPVGLALAEARRALAHYPVALWGVFALYGDPNLELPRAATVTHTRRLTLSWDAHVGRFLATRSAEARNRALTALDEARDRAAGGTALLDAAAAWLAVAFQPSDQQAYHERLELCRAWAMRDVVAACELRMLLAMETIAGVFLGVEHVDLMFAAEEISVGLQCAQTVHDTIALPAFIHECARALDVDVSAPALAHMLEEAVGMLEGWVQEEPAAAELLAQVTHVRALLLQRARI